jgi:ribosome-associated translation inhibitor RaiA
MTINPAQVTFRHMDPSPAVEARIQQEAADLDRYFARITSCHVVVDAPHQHHKLGGRTYHISIEIDVPGSKIVVNHEPSLHSTLVQGEAGEWEKHLEAHPDHRDIYVCIRDAFSAARRRLEDYARVLRGDTKHHAPNEEAAP